MRQDVGLSTALRAPMQGRSLASYERMVAAAQKLMVDRGSDDFTLNEVSQAGKVSIGSIYNRFESKDALVHAVQLRILDRIDTAMNRRLAEAIETATGFDKMVVRLIEAVAETLKEFADQLRPLMARAQSDTVVATTGKASYRATFEAFQSALLAYRDQILQPDPERATENSFRIFYSAVARYLGFGFQTTGAWEGDWDSLKEDLARMIYAFLTSSPPAAMTRP